MFDTNGIKIEPKLQINLGKGEWNKRIGILNKGKETKIISNEFSGQDVAIQDEGEGMLARDNKIK